MSVESDLEQELDWRFAELSSLKVQAVRAGTGTHLQRSLLRALVAMLYAHYEGFCKTAIRLYLREVQNRLVSRRDCISEIVVFSLQKSFREAKNRDTSGCWDYFQLALPTEIASPIVFDLDEDGKIALEGDSNLYPKHLRANLQSAGLPCDFLDSSEQHLRSLVGRRNQIAHGEKLEIGTIPIYEEHERAVSEVLYELAYSVVSALEASTYLKPFPYEG